MSDLAAGLLECVVKMGKTPKVVDSDAEIGLSYRLLKKYSEE